MEYDANQIIIREDEFNNNLYILLEGSAGHVINKWTTNANIEMTINTLSTGDVIGDNALR